jgi:hypothetical protein
LLIISGLLVAWSLAPGSAVAFEQKPAAPTPNATPVVPEQVPELKSDPHIISGLDDETAERGWKIPGLGSINLFPKLDFGLELLYSDGQQQELEDGTGRDDVTIRGTVKRRF